MTIEPDADKPRHVVTIHMQSVEEAVEAVRAADTLGLGCVLRNELRPGQHEGVAIAQQVWLVDVLSDAPLAEDEPR